MMTLEYPQSRVSGATQCDECRGQRGFFEDRGTVTMETKDGTFVKLLARVCNYCGFTMLLDPSVMERTPYRGEGEEVAPDYLQH